MRIKMRKIVFSTIFVLTLCYWRIEGRPSQTKPGCWYEGKRYQEAEGVNTSEPCLRCRCTEGSLRCRLRVCPRLPNPVPSGCITVETPRDDPCCPELVCAAESREKKVTARGDPGEESGRQENGGCVHEGVRYGPGSAMMGSRRCEYCYCISGSRRCLRPRCLLPLAGCIPLYAPYSCCPVAYNCTNSSDDSFPSVVSASSPGAPLRYGCRVGDRSYEEGEMVREAGWKGRCDNCFCAMGGVRCVPLSCAPPLQGCTPIVPRGQCCPSTYNCSGTIEVKANQNYASYAFVSKDYAKFRKETNFFSMGRVREESTANSEARAHKSPDVEREAGNEEDSTSIASTLAQVPAVTATIDETLNRTSVRPEDEGSSLAGETEEEETAVTTPSPGGYASSKEENVIATETTTTMTTTMTTTTMTTMTIDEKTETAIGTSNLETTLRNELPTSTELVDDENGFETYDDASVPKIITSSMSTIRVSVTKDPTSVEPTIHRGDPEETVPPAKVASEGPGKREEEKTASTLQQQQQQPQSFSEAIIESSSVISVKESTAGAANTTGSPSTVLMPDNMYVINVTLRTNVSVGHVQQQQQHQPGVTMNPVRSVPPDIEAIIDMSNRKKGEENYEYDYEEPTLPPSLPNLRIIPFVAADALVKQDEDVSSSHVTNYPLGAALSPPPPPPPPLLLPQELGPTVAASSGSGNDGSATPDHFYGIVKQKNRFSPPVETEGGFVPREPSYLDPPYRSTDRNSQIRTGVTAVVPADMTNSHRRNDELTGICVFENRNYRHGDLLPSSGHCIICVCYYGEVACSDEKCPPLKIGCRRLNNDKICCGKIICVDAEESPTVVLDRADAIAPPPRAPLPSLDGIVSPDPFRDVIKTKPAPDLPSLIEDMIPYLVEHRITKPSITETMTTESAELSLLTDTRPDQKIVEPIQNGSRDAENGPCSGAKTSISGEHSDAKQSQGIGSKASGMSTAEGLVEASGPDDSSIFSFGGVLDLLFPEEAKPSEAPNATISSTRSSTLASQPSSASTGSTHRLDLSVRLTDAGLDNGTTIDPKTAESLEAFESSFSSIATESTAVPPTAGSVAWIKPEEDSSLTPSAGLPESTGSTRAFADNEIVTSLSGLLKLAGCNIYGRIYRLGRIITELSSPCLECGCTELGVQCKQLDC